VSAARGLQSYLDVRERWVLPTLLAPGNFPYRLTHVVEKRVLLGSGTLDGGGAERQIINTIEGLRARGVDDVHLLVEYLDEGKANAFYLDKAAKVAASIVRPADRQHITHPWVLEHARFRAVVSDWLASQILRNAETIKQLSPEIVQCSLDWPNITVGMAAVLAGVPHVLISGRNIGPRHFAFFQWFMFPCYRALAAHPNVHFLNNSEAGRDDYARWLRIPAQKIRVLRNGLHTGEFAPVDDNARIRARSELGLAPSARIIAGAFRLSDEKQPTLWLDTAARVKAQLPDAIFLHCGIGPLQPEVEARARRLGLTDSLKLLGARKDIQTIFAAADLVLHTSLLEGTPNTLIEAQAMGIPVVTTPARGAAEAVEHGVTGLVVRNETASALAGAVVDILSDPAAVARAREAGPSFVKARFGFDRMIDDTLTAYADAGVPWAIDLLPPNKRYLAWVDLDGSQLVHDGGHAFRVHLPQFEGIADTADEPCRSSLFILEDGRPLGPAHTPHEHIRAVGKGAFSHWDQCCYFSSSDGSAVTTNGRRYTVVVPRPGQAAAV
jgi:glycosyltransferase involved in cell wall biosynthesis